MKSPLPMILRKGAIVRVADEADTSGYSAWAETYVDLRFEDGHVERWAGAGSLHEGPLAELEDPAALVKWGSESLLDQTGSLLAALGIEFKIGRDRNAATREQLDAAPVEIVIERHAKMPHTPPDGQEL